MSHAAALAEINRVFQQAWTSGSLAGLSIDYQNHPFKQPTSAWGRLTISCGKTTPQALGGPSRKVTRTPFILTLQLFIPINEGTKAAAAAADIMAKLDHTSTGSSTVTVRFETAGWEQVAKDESSFVPFNISIAGTYDIRKS